VLDRYEPPLPMWGSDSLDAFAVCHCGEATEAGRDACFIKFAAGQDRVPRLPSNVYWTPARRLQQDRGLQRSAAGVNVNRRLAYHQMLRQGFRTDIQGVAMPRRDFLPITGLTFLWWRTGVNL
jgi:hypothetical protein